MSLIITENEVRAMIRRETSGLRNDVESLKRDVRKLTCKHTKRVHREFDMGNGIPNAEVYCPDCLTVFATGVREAKSHMYQYHMDKMLDYEREARK